MYQLKPTHQAKTSHSLPARLPFPSPVTRRWLCRSRRQKPRSIQRCFLIFKLFGYFNLLLTSFIAVCLEFVTVEARSVMGLVWERWESTMRLTKPESLRLNKIKLTISRSHFVLLKLDAVWSKIGFKVAGQDETLRITVHVRTTTFTFFWRVTAKLNSYFPYFPPPSESISNSSIVPVWMPTDMKLGPRAAMPERCRQKMVHIFYHFHKMDNLYLLPSLPVPVCRLSRSRSRWSQTQRSLSNRPNRTSGMFCSTYSVSQMELLFSHLYPRLTSQNQDSALFQRTPFGAGDDHHPVVFIQTAGPTKKHEKRIG